MSPAPTTSTRAPTTERSVRGDQRPASCARTKPGMPRCAASVAVTAHSAVDGVCAPRALHSSTPSGSRPTNCSAPARQQLHQPQLRQRGEQPRRRAGPRRAAPTPAPAAASPDGGPPAGSPAVRPHPRRDPPPPPRRARWRGPARAASRRAELERGAEARLPTRARPLGPAAAAGRARPFRAAHVLWRGRRTAGRAARAAGRPACCWRSCWAGAAAAATPRRARSGRCPQGEPPGGRARRRRSPPAPAPSGPADPQSGQQAGDPNVVAAKLAVPTGLAVLPDGSAVVGERATGRLLQVFPDRSPARVLMTVGGLDATGDGGLLGAGAVAHLRRGRPALRLHLHRHRQPGGALPDRRDAEPGAHRHPARPEPQRRRAAVRPPTARCSSAPATPATRRWPRTRRRWPARCCTSTSSATRSAAAPVFATGLGDVTALCTARRRQGLRHRRRPGRRPGRARPARPGRRPTAPGPARCRRWSPCRPGRAGSAAARRPAGPCSPVRWTGRSSTS